MLSLEAKFYITDVNTVLRNQLYLNLVQVLPVIHFSSPILILVA